MPQAVEEKAREYKTRELQVSETLEENQHREAGPRYHLSSGAQTQHCLMSNAALSQEDFSYMNNEMIQWLQLHDALGIDIGWGRRYRDRRALHPCGKILKYQKVVFLRNVKLFLQRDMLAWSVSFLGRLSVQGQVGYRKMEKCSFPRVHVSNKVRIGRHAVTVHMKTGSAVNLQPSQEAEQPCRLRSQEDAALRGDYMSGYASHSGPHSTHPPNSINFLWQRVHLICMMNEKDTIIF